MARSRGNELCTTFADWMDGWPFTAFLSMSIPYGLRGHRSIAARHQSRVDRLLEGFGKSWDAEVGALGTFTLSYAGHLHGHLLALREDGKLFTPPELEWLERKWPHNADARPVTNKAGVVDYIASENHLVRCRASEIIVFGDDTLKSTRIEMPPSFTPVEISKAVSRNDKRVRL